MTVVFRILAGEQLKNPQLARYIARTGTPATGVPLVRFTTVPRKCHRSLVGLRSDHARPLFPISGNRRVYALYEPAEFLHEVIDLAALRQFAMRGVDSWNPDVVRTIHGYDAAVIWKGAHASTS